MPLLNEETKKPWEPETPLLASFLFWIGLIEFLPAMFCLYQGYYGAAGAFVVSGVVLLGIAQLVDKMHANSARMVRMMEEKEIRERTAQAPR